MARTKPEEPELVVCIESHCTSVIDEQGNEYDVVYRRGDRERADAPGLDKTRALYWLPEAEATVSGESEHRRRHGLHHHR